PVDLQRLAAHCDSDSAAWNSSWWIGGDLGSEFAVAFPLLGLIGGMVGQDRLGVFMGRPFFVFVWAVW
ncbi:MAG: hypothetical protein ACKPKO_20425, partial [Candidatus Fonsibacter sp.]